MNNDKWGYRQRERMERMFTRNTDLRIGEMLICASFMFVAREKAHIPH